MRTAKETFYFVEDVMKLPLMGKSTPGRRRTSRTPWPSSGSWTRP